VQIGDEICFPKKELCQSIEDDMSVTLGDKLPSNSTDKNWVDRFRTGHLSTEDGEHSGRPTQMGIPENLDAIHSTILDDRRISAKKITETLAIS
jgi:hypothetical protein